LRTGTQDGVRSLKARIVPSESGVLVRSAAEARNDSAYDGESTIGKAIETLSHACSTRH
jgi:hypothetical protein